jgi:probable addiction module antidote protein
MNTKVKFSKYDTVDFLETEEDILAYFDAVMEENSDDPALIAKALGNIAKARGMTRVANDTGLSRENLYRALSGEVKPDFDTVLKVIKALGLKLKAASA